MTRSVLTKNQVDVWGWRVPFLFSLLLAPILYNIVKNTEESKLWEESKEQKETEQIIREAENADRPAIVDLFSSPFRRSELRGVLTEKQADLMNFVVVGVYIVFLLCCGKLSDKFPHRKDLFRIGFPGLIVAAPAMFAMFESNSMMTYFLAQIIFAFCLAMVEGGKAAWEVELWMSDPTLSFTGVAVGHNIAATIFGGTMPLVATFLFYRADQLNALARDAVWPRMLPGFYIAVLCCIALYCITFVVRHPHDVRTGGAKLKAAVERENRKFNEVKQKRKEKRKQVMLEQQSGYPLSADNERYVPPIV
jgi:MFS transporter, MHS family, proline/betaine transporter